MSDDRPITRTWRALDLAADGFEVEEIGPNMVRLTPYVDREDGTREELAAFRLSDLTFEHELRRLLPRALEASVNRIRFWSIQ